MSAQTISFFNDYLNNSLKQSMIISKRLRKLKSSYKAYKYQPRNQELYEILKQMIKNQGGKVVYCHDNLVVIEYTKGYQVETVVYKISKN